MMKDIQGVFIALCSLTILRSSLSLLLPDGTTKRFAEYGFNIVQTLMVLRWFEKIAAEWIGAWK